MPAPSPHVAARAAWLCAFGLTLIGCAAKSPVRLPSTLAGQLPADYRLGHPADQVVYIGTIHIDQRCGFWDMALDRVHVDFSVTDDYDKSVADFRARYPQFAETPVHKRLATVVPTAP